MGYDYINITRVIGSPVIGLDNAHHAVRGRVFPQRVAAIASTHDISAAQPIQRVEAASDPPPPTRPALRTEQEQRGSGVRCPAAPALYLPKCSAPNSPIKQWSHMCVSQTADPLRATDLLNNAAMAPPAAMKEEDNGEAGSPPGERE